MITLRPYQTEIAEAACGLLKNYGIAYLSMEVRCGKTLTALQAASHYGATNPLFITKKKAIGSIEADYATLAPSYRLTVINYEQLHNFQHEGFDLVICDEAHCLGQFPVPAQRVKLLKNICNGLPVMFLSGTPTPESYSQIFHQLFVSSFSPFAEYTNFYKWAKDYVTLKIKYVFNRQLNDYSCAKQDLIEEKINHLFLSYTQTEAGFITEGVKEKILIVEMRPATLQLAEKLKRDRVHIGKNGEEILCDTEVKLMQKLHQVYSGTVLTESGNGICFDDSKATAIRDLFRHRKIAIFYKFKAEFELLKKVFGDKITISPEEFQASNDKTFCSQIQSGREGIDLSTAHALVMFNIDFSSVSYQQARARIQAKDRTRECLLYWVFANGGIEQKIYDRVITKQDYTIYYFKRDFKIKKDAVLKTA